MGLVWSVQVGARTAVRFPAIYDALEDRRESTLRGRLLCPWHKLRSALLKKNGQFSLSPGSLTEAPFSVQIVRFSYIRDASVFLGGEG